MKPYQRFYEIDKDFRNPYARDRDRIIHSGSFRKNIAKTVAIYGGGVHSENKLF